VGSGQFPKTLKVWDLKTGRALLRNRR